MAEGTSVGAPTEGWAGAQAKVAVALRFFFIAVSLVLIQVDAAPNQLLRSGLVQGWLLVSCAVLTWLSIRLQDTTGPSTRRLAAVVVAGDLANHLAIVSVLDPDGHRGFAVVILVAVIEAATIGQLRWAMVTWATATVGLLAIEIAVAGLNQEVLVGAAVRAFFTNGPALAIGKQAERLARVVERERDAHEQHRHWSMTDELTRLPNRRALFAALDELAERPDPYTLVFVDLNGFKAVNDTRGHEAGDDVLRIVARRLEAAIRTSDSAYRLAGDEFVLLLRAIDRERIDAVVGRLEASIAQDMDLGGEPLSLTCAVGIATSSEAPTAEAVLSRADESMYAAKRTPRSDGIPSPGAVRASR